MNPTPENPCLEQLAFNLFKPPFRYDRMGGYFWDADNHQVADNHYLPENATLRIRGWGRISYLPNPEELQDAAGDLLAKAMTFYWESRKFGAITNPARYAWGEDGMYLESSGAWVRQSDYVSTVGALMAQPALNWSEAQTEPSLNFTRQGLVDALGEVRALHDMSVELIAESVFTRLTGEPRRVALAELRPEVSRVEREFSIGWMKENPELFDASFAEFMAKEVRPGWKVRTKTSSGFMTLITAPAHDIDAEVA